MQLRGLVPSKDSIENSEVILSSPQTIIETDLTVEEETMTWSRFSVILEHPSTERTFLRFTLR